MSGVQHTAAVSAATQNRRRQRRPQLQSEYTIPEDIKDLLTEAHHAVEKLRLLESSASALTVRSMESVCLWLKTLRDDAPTPDKQLHAVSRITDALREGKVTRKASPKQEVDKATDTPPTGASSALASVLVSDFAAPLLLDCRVRYLHRGLTTLLRSVYPAGLPAEHLVSLQTTFSARLIHQWDLHSDHGHRRPCLFPYDLADFVEPNNSLSPTAHCSDDIMTFLNCVDGLTGTLMPFCPSVFLNTFLDVLPLLADCLQWTVANAVSRRRRGVVVEDTRLSAAGDRVDSEEAVFGEDLEHIRFCVRVVATYTHKYASKLNDVWGLSTSHEGTEAERLAVLALSRSVEPVVFMLSSNIFPKDVLNATGLLLANILTIRSRKPQLILAVCRQACGTPGQPLAPSPASVAHRARSAACRHFVDVVCASDPVAALQQRPEGRHALTDVFGGMSNNGRFAFLKGLLAHLSSPTDDADPCSVGVLLHPVTSGVMDGSTPSAPVVIAYDLIIPAAEAFTTAVQEPETRFMAIQTVDCVVRHVVAVFGYAVQCCGADCRKGSSDNARGKSPSEGGKKPLAADKAELALQYFDQVCRPTEKLLAVLNGATQLVMALWDDGTQQMSGPLYETYDRVLRVNELLKSYRSLRADPHSSAVTDSVIDARTTTVRPIDTTDVLRGVLSVQNERRGKYHALLGLLSVMAMDDVLSVLCGHYTSDGAIATHSRDARALIEFSRMLLSGASNHKVANVAGDVFTRLAGMLLRNNKDLLRNGLLEPFACAVVLRHYTAVTSNVSESVNVTNMIAHFAYPLMKQSKEYLPLLLDAVFGAGQGEWREELGSSGANAVGFESRRKQGVVEVLARARSSGVDITTHLEPGTRTFAVVLDSLQSMNWDVRRIALGLCTQSSKNVEPVARWQCAVMEQFLSLNMNLGGDTTARRELTSAFKAWTERTSNSFRNASARATKLADKDDTDGSTERQTCTAYTRLVVSHWQRLAQLFAAHYGTTSVLAEGFTVERRAAACTLYIGLLNTVLPSLATVKSPESDGDAMSRVSLSASLFVPGVASSLVKDLSNGWSLLRALAGDLLSVFCKHAPTTTLSVEVFSGNVEDLIRSAHEEIASAQSFRVAEGAVARYMLFLNHSGPDQCITAAFMYAKLENELRELVTLTEELKALQAARGRGENARAVYHWLQSNPLHGRLSLCADELAAAHRKGKSIADGHSTLSQHAMAGDRLLSICCTVIQLCSSLVGNAETSSIEGGNMAPDATATEVVDCRGHVYDRENPQAESQMRRVVNNTWLGIRVATLAIHRVLSLTPIEHLSIGQVRQLCYDLMEALLLTKHNGVMRCVRGALKAVTEALVRCREPDFYRLPGEMLLFLLGSEGVASNDFYRMLRRSQGLPHAILAVLEAEDTKVPFVLFPTAMKRLLAIAQGGESSPGPSRASAPPLLSPDNASKPRVVGDNAETVRESQRSNALNVLKFMFEDKLFAERSVAYIEEAFSISTSGFDSHSWYIRNSALMLFSSVLQRFVGEHPSTGGSGANTSLHDVAKRTPRGVAFALRELTSTNGTQRDGLLPGAEPEPRLALFPILQMLSMLSPDPPHLVSRATTPSLSSALTHSDAAGGDSAAMVKAVLGCGVSANVMIRSASAVALSCLLPSAYVCETIEQIAETQLRSRVDNNGKIVYPTLNKIHGALQEFLQLHTHYVGTMRRSRRLHRLSSSATPQVAESVNKALRATVLLHHDTVARASALSPTVAATLLMLLHDLLYFGARTSQPGPSVKAGGITRDGTDDDTLLRTAAFALARVQQLVETPADSYRTVRADVGQAKEAGALLVLIASRLVSPAGMSSDARSASTAPSRVAAVKELVQRIVKHEVAQLDFASSEKSHNLVSWMLDHLHYLCSSESLVEGSLAFFSGASDAGSDTVDRSAVGSTDRDLAVLSSVTLIESFGAQDVIRTCSLSALTRLFTVSSSPTHLGCVAWGEVVSHLQFAVSLAREKGAALSDQHVILQSELSKHVGHAPGQRARRGTISNSEAQSAVIHYLARRAATDGPTLALSGGLVSLLSSHALPEQPMVCRQAVVASLQDIFEAVDMSAVSQMGAEQRRHVALLILLLVRLLLDDSNDTRESACAVSATLLNRAHSSRDADAAARKDLTEGPKDVMSSVLSCILLLRSLGDDAFSAADVNEFLVSPPTAAATDSEGEEQSEDTAAQAGAEEGDSESDDDEEVLFSKEAANMYIEHSLLLFVCSCLRRDGASTPPALDALRDLVDNGEKANTLSLVLGLPPEKQQDTEERI